MASFIASIGTSLPKFRNSQEDIAAFMIRNLPLDEAGARRLKALYRSSGISSRYSVLPDFSSAEALSFFRANGQPFPSVKSRMELYRREAVNLASAACERAIKSLNAETTSEVSHLITVSCTGMYAPGLDIDLVRVLGLPTSTQRTAVNFMGCYAAFNALKLADQIVRADSRSTVLIVCVELCSIHLQNATGDEDLLANSLFGDGAAAVVVTSPRRARSIGFLTSRFHNELAQNGATDMGWFIGDHGFEMKLSRQIPHLIEGSIAKLTSKFMATVRDRQEDISHFAVHPGGKKILDVVEDHLGISPGENECSREVLRDMGNMSSATILFVLEKILSKISAENDGERVLAFAFGPGLTLEGMLLEVRNASA